MNLLFTVYSFIYFIFLAVSISSSLNLGTLAVVNRDVVKIEKQYGKQCKCG